MVTKQHLVVHCVECSAVWDLDYQPEACTCDGEIDLTELIPVFASSHESAVAAVRRDLGYGDG